MIYEPKTIAKPMIAESIASLPLIALCSDPPEVISKKPPYIITTIAKGIEIVSKKVITFCISWLNSGQPQPTGGGGQIGTMPAFRESNILTNVPLTRLIRFPRLVKLSPKKAYSLLLILSYH